METFQKCFSQAVHTYTTRYGRTLTKRYYSQRGEMFQTPQDIFRFYREIQNAGSLSVRKASLLKLTYATSKIIGNPSLREDIHPILDQIFLSEELNIRFQMEARNTSKIQNILKRIRDIIGTNQVTFSTYHIQQYETILEDLHNESSLIRFGNNGNIDTTIASMQTLAEHLSLQESDRELLQQLFSELITAFDAIPNSTQGISKQRGKYIHLRHEEDAQIQHLNMIRNSLDTQPLPLQERKQYREDIDKKINTLSQKGKIIHFSVASRSKSMDSILGKSLFSIGYANIENFKDRIGVTFSLKDKDELLSLMYHVYNTFALQKKDIISKGLITQKDIDLFIQQHHIPKDSDFITRISQSIVDEQEKQETNKKNKKNNTAENYQDIKVTGFSNISYQDYTYTLGTEIKFVLENTKNEDGFSFHGIYDITKRLTELSRLEGYISYKDIVHYLDSFFQNLDISLRAVNKTREEWFQEIYYDRERTRIKHRVETQKKVFAHPKEEEAYIDAEVQTGWNRLEYREGYTRNAIHEYLFTLITPLERDGKKDTKYVEKNIAKQSEKIQNAVKNALNTTSKEEKNP